MEEVVWLAIASLVAVGMLTIAIAKLFHDIRSGRISASTERKNSIQQQKLVKALTKVVRSYDNEVAHLRREVQALRSETKSTRSLEQAGIDIQKQKLAQRERQAEWEKIRDIAKGIGWVLEHVDLEEDDWEE